MFFIGLIMIIIGVSGYLICTKTKASLRRVSNFEAPSVLIKFQAA